jgi:hypothetical protein
MRMRILDLDGGLLLQQRLLAQCDPEVVSLADWGPRIRLACGFSGFGRFERALSDSASASEPVLTLFGSGDFHHVSLALVRRLAGPFNLLVLDKHPDWMRGIPFLHCGTWLYHAARLPQVRHVFHVGGELDFDNHYRWLAPWPLLTSGKVRVFPAVRTFRRGPWSGIANQPVRPQPDVETTAERVEALLAPHADDLARWPLYVSVDKDVLVAADAAVNWDSGCLRLDEAAVVLRAFVAAAGGRLAGMDVLGDWSPVRLRGLGRRLLHWAEHPSPDHDPVLAARLNERANLALLEAVGVAAWARPNIATAARAS